MDQDTELKRLRDDMEQAKALYEGAKLEVERAVEGSQDLGRMHPDRSLRHVSQARTYALHAYRDSLMRFNRFILDRKPSTG